MPETTKKATHTPGPWRARTGIRDTEDAGQIVIETGLYECDVARINVRKENAAANARLIAAAPELLAAAERFLAAGIVSAYGNTAAAVESMRLAVAKAKEE